MCTILAGNLNQNTHAIYHKLYCTSFPLLSSWAMAVLICDMCFWWNGILGWSLSWELQSHRANCNESENDHCNTYTWQRQHFHEHNTFLSHKEAWPKLSVIIKKACLLQKPTNWWQRSITYSTRAGTILCFTTSIYWSIFIAIYQYIERVNSTKWQRNCTNDNEFVVVHCPIHITWESEMGPNQALWFLLGTILVSLAPALAAIVHN